MEVESVVRGKNMIFRITEKIIADSEIDELAKKVEEELKKGGKKIVISFLPPSYPYSPVLSALTRCYRIAQQYNASVAVVAPKQEFIDVLLETHLDRMFEILRSEEELGKG